MFGDFCKIIGFILLVAMLFIVSICGLIIANEKWNCRTYATVAKTQMMGGTCYVQTPQGKWVTHSAYVLTKHLDIEVR